jgi:uncharacterized membrane protein
MIFSFISFLSIHKIEYCLNQCQGSFMGYEPNLKSAKDMAFIVYILYICSYFVGITAIVGVIIAYVQKDEAEGTWINDHFIWQINTFLILLPLMVIGIITTFFLIGFVIIIAAGIWGIYRIVKGIIRFREERSPYN